MVNVQSVKKKYSGAVREKEPPFKLEDNIGLGGREGCNDVDPKMMEVYSENHNPKYSYTESIATLKDRKDLPKELYDLDILDGSPPLFIFIPFFILKMFPFIY